MRPFGARPLSFRRGLEVLARAAQARCMPVAIRYTFFEAEKPDVLCEVGAPHGPLPLAECEAKLQALVDRLRDAHGVDGFLQLIHGGRGVAERWDRARGLSQERA